MVDVSREDLKSTIDEIDRLRAENDDLHKINEQTIAAIDEAERLRAENDRLRQQRGIPIIERAENDRLRAALEQTKNALISVQKAGYDQIQNLRAENERLVKLNEYYRDQILVALKKLAAAPAPSQDTARK